MHVQLEKHKTADRVWLLLNIRYHHHHPLSSHETSCFRVLLLHLVRPAQDSCVAAAPLVPGAEEVVGN